MKWTTITQFVDHETGEALNIRHIEKGIYIKIKLNTTYKKHNENYGTRYNTWQCERNKQTEIKF